MPKQSRKRSVSDSSRRRRAASSAVSRRPADDGSPKILVVDDEVHQRTVVYHALREAGYSVTEAIDGEEALGKLKRTRFDLVLLDIMMPKMSGYEVLEKIRSMPSRADTRVIVLTAKHDPEGVMREMIAGADEHVAKPFLPSELAEIVKRVLATERKLSEGRETLKRTAGLYDAVNQLRRGAQETD